jgi:VWFA-related protein
MLYSAAWPQTNTSSSSPAAGDGAKPSAEITSRDETATFKVKVNLVEVRVVVRDSRGQAIGNLKQEDFQLLDNGKPATISRFAVERASTSAAVSPAQAGAKAASAAGSAQPPASAVPQRFILYLFDDLHLSLADLSQVIAAAKKQLQPFPPYERVAIFTTSGQGQLDFTDNFEELIATLNRLRPRSLINQGVTPCPNISYYTADLIENKQDLMATAMAVQDGKDCLLNVDANSIHAYSRRVLNLGDQEVRLCLDSLNGAIHRIAAMPGERIIVLVSPGFMNKGELQKQWDVANRALHSNVVINTMDARGLYTSMPDVSETRPYGPETAGQMMQYTIAEDREDQFILADYADATGGTFFHNNNDLNEGFQRLASPPAVSYLLAFTPQELKLDGKYHSLKVILKPPTKGTIQARKGYYAPKGPADATEQAKQDIEDAVFSREEVRDIPIDLHTQFFKSNQEDAKLSVIARVDVRHIHFRKDNGRNNNDVTIVSAVFDGDGNFVAGTQKVLQLHLKDETLESKLGSGLVLKSNFDVKPGNYVIRLVVRGEDGQLAAENSSVEIP